MNGPVTPIEWCQWCRSHVTEGHACPYATPCPTAEGHPCGVCSGCLEAQAADLKAHGTPSDINDMETP